MNPLTHIANATNLMFAMLVTELDKRGALSKSDFATLLKRSADDASKSAQHAELGGDKRLDLALMRNVADLIEKGPDQPPPPWVPVVHEGGKSSR